MGQTYNKHPCKIIFLLWMIFLTGCSTTHKAVSDPDFAPTRPITSIPLPVIDGAIYKAGYNISLFQDTKAHQVGDIITVILQEKTQSSKTSSTTTSKEASVDIAAPTIFGRGVGVGGDSAILNVGIDASRDFTGKGDSNQGNSLTGKISVTVVEVLHNGNLIVRGEKLLTLNQGSEHVRISGIIRSLDINPDNTISSTLVANAKIIYGGQGVLAEANTKGWFQRVVDGNWWPF